MSLVNDALKKAAEAQKNRAPVPVVHLPLKPAEPAKEKKSGVGLVLPATLITILLAALYSLHLVKRSERTPAPTESATPAEKPASKPVALIKDLAPAPLIVAAREVPTSPPPATATQTSAPAVVATPLPPPLRLQAVFYTPPQPSAIVSGKTLRVGDMIREMQVVAIGSSSVLLISQSQTNFLTLE